MPDGGFWLPPASPGSAAPAAAVPSSRPGRRRADRFSSWRSSCSIRPASRAISASRGSGAAAAASARDAASVPVSGSPALAGFPVAPGRGTDAAALVHKADKASHVSSVSRSATAAANSLCQTVTQSRMKFRPSPSAGRSASGDPEGGSSLMSHSRFAAFLHTGATAIRSRCVKNGDPGTPDPRAPDKACLMPGAQKSSFAVAA